jgi:hypothetical protein
LLWPRLALGGRELSIVFRREAFLKSPTTCIRVFLLQGDWGVLLPLSPFTESAVLQVKSPKVPLGPHWIPKSATGLDPLGPYVVGNPPRGLKPPWLARWIFLLCVCAMCLFCTRAYVGSEFDLQ